MTTTPKHPKKHPDSVYRKLESRHNTHSTSAAVSVHCLLPLCCFVTMALAPEWSCKHRGRSWGRHGCELLREEAGDGSHGRVVKHQRARQLRVECAADLVPELHRACYHSRTCLLSTHSKHGCSNHAVTAWMQLDLRAPAGSIFISGAVCTNVSEHDSRGSACGRRAGFLHGSSVIADEMLADRGAGQAAGMELQREKNADLGSQAQLQRGAGRPPRGRPAPMPPWYSAAEGCPPMTTPSKCCRQPPPAAQPPVPEPRGLRP